MDRGPDGRLDHRRGLPVLADHPRTTPIGGTVMRFLSFFAFFLAVESAAGQEPEHRTTEDHFRVMVAGSSVRLSEVTDTTRVTILDIHGAVSMSACCYREKVLGSHPPCFDIPLNDEEMWSVVAMPTKRPPLPCVVRFVAVAGTTHDISPCSHHWRWNPLTYVWLDAFKCKATHHGLPCPWQQWVTSRTCRRCGREEIVQAESTRKETK